MDPFGLPSTQHRCIADFNLQRLQWIGRAAFAGPPCQIGSLGDAKDGRALVALRLGTTEHAEAHR